MKKMRVVLGALSGALALILASCGGGGSGSITPEVAPGTVGEFPQKVQDCASLVSTLDPNDEKVILFWYDSSVASANKYDIYTAYNWVPGTAGDEDKMVDFLVDSGSNIAYADFSEAYDDLVTPVQNAIDSNSDFGFIIREISAWNKKTGDETFPLSRGKHAMFIGGDIYTISDNMTATISSAQMESITTMKVVLGVKYGLETFASDNGFVLTADDGTTISIVDAVNFNAQGDRSKNNTQTILLTLGSAIDTSKVWTLSHADFGSKVVATSAVVAEEIGDLKYTGDDLGLTLNGTTATFKVWAPTASDVKVLLYASAADVGNYNAASIALKVPGAITDSELLGTVMDNGTVQMTKDVSTGVWSATVENCTAKYYKYQITVAGKTYYVCDIYAKAASADSIAAQITDINTDSSAIPSNWEVNYTNPFGNTGAETKKYNDAVIYEMHIRDWSRAEDSDSTGKFLDIANSDAIINHLKDLGVTHVQILPMFDYAQVNADKNYNWGYNPYHYNVPEGRYVTEGYTDGTQAVKEMRQMIAALHDADIAVVMDVVYNHTSGTGAGSLYDSTVPYYYYRIKKDGTYSNGSGCGNETNSEAPMFKKYMIDTLKHWMLDYHINGFRFDLMGLHSKATMEEIGAALKEIDSNVLVYGEPWTGGDSLVSETTKAAGTNYGCFDDDFRDAIKGAEFGGFNAGQVQISSFTSTTKTPVSYSDAGILAGIIGKSGSNKRNETGITGHALHYAECHDNFTLYDKLVYSLDIDSAKTADGKNNIATVFPSSITDEQLELVKAQDKLAASFIILSQGMPFLNGGQEFMRTKKGNPDSYSADTKGGVTWTSRYGTNGTYVAATDIDDVNTIDLTMKTTNNDVYNVYKGLIALRKSNAAFTAPVKTTSKKLDKGITLYTVTDGTNTFAVYFNATGTEKNIAELDKNFESAGYTKLVDVSSGTPTESTTLPASVGAKSFVILKK